MKYGFLFIGFTFALFLMFDLIGGVRVAAPEYVLIGARRSSEGCSGALRRALRSAQPRGLSLLIGSGLLFAALAAIMYLTRDIDWGARPGRPEPTI